MNIRADAFFRVNRSILASLLLMITSGSLWGGYASTVRLISVEQAGAPVVRDKQLIFRTHVVFSEAPENYWIFYDKRNSRLVMDIYGHGVDAPQGPGAVRGEIFKSVEAETRKTSMSLSGIQTRLYMQAGEGWHFEAETISREIIQISAWRNIGPPKIAMGKGRRAALYAITAAAVSAATFLIIVVVLGALRE